MRTLGIDLAITAEHRAIVRDGHGRWVTPVLKFRTRVADLDQLLARAREGTRRCKLQAVMEPTGMAWFPVAVYLIRQGVTVYVVNSQQVADLRRYYRRHAKSDRIDSRVLAQLPGVNPEKLHQLRLPTAATLACQRGCTQLDRWSRQITALKNRVRALNRFAWPEWETVFPDPFAVEARWVCQHWYDPQKVVAAGAGGVQQAWRESGLNPADSGAWAEPLVALAHQVLTLYGPEPTYVDFEALQAEQGRELTQLAELEDRHHTLQLKTVRPLYRQLQPERYLETIKGVGQDSAAIYASFIGDPARFDSLRVFRGWTGMVPASKESATTETKGLHISQAGPRLIKKYAFLDAESARQWDPQIAALYYDQMVHKGKHHNQAICVCATHLLNRVLVVLRDHKPFELRDPEGNPVTVDEARSLILAKYTVPDAVRQRTTKHFRQTRRDQGAEKKQKREIARTGVRSKP
jgi:transposase